MTPTLNESQIAWTRIDRSSNALLWPAVVLMVVAVVGCSVLLFGLEDLIAKFERPYLIPWVLATGLVIVLPLIYFKRKGKFTFANPVVYPSLVYFLPVFFIGGWSLVFGWSHYPYLNYVSDPEWNFPLAFVYVMLGIGGLALGFIIPTGKRIGSYFSSYLPNWDFKTGELIFLGAALLPIGFYIVVSAIEMGTIGYQGAVDGPSLQTIGSLSTFFTFVIPACQLFLWIAFFRIERWNRYKILVLCIQLSAFVFFTASAGSRGGMVSGFLWFLFGMSLSKKKIKTPHLVLLGIAGFLVLFLSISYGNTFRLAKGGISKVSSEQYFQTAIDSFYAIGTEDFAKQFDSSLSTILERIEITSSLAVIVSNHELLARYESETGLDNNIWTYTWTSLIPRFLWKDKPAVADAYSYSDLYFDSGWSVYSITVMGDLLRNFGPIGVPLGMILLGFLLRIFYATLLEDLTFVSWKGVLFCVVLSRISYESFYGQILPDAARIAVVVGLQIFLMRVATLLFRGLRR